MSRHSNAKHLLSIDTIISKSGNPDEDFFYLGGPMTGIPSFNFPRFHFVSDVLREQGYNIISPAELDDPAVEAAAISSVDGAPGSGHVEDAPYEDFLSRDLIVVSLPTCVGGIFLEGWQNSRGARGESWVLQFLNKQLWEFEESDEDFKLNAIAHRDERLAELGVDTQGVPTDMPGVMTMESA
jgi:hypothetical protein